MKKYKSACDSLRPGQLDRLTAKIKDHKPDRCLICEKPVYDYKPDLCCNGSECSCMGQPINPCVCSIECDRAIFDFIGLPFNERRKKAGIKKWSK